MGPYRADHLVLREEPEHQTENKNQKTKLGISDTRFLEEKFIITELQAKDFFNFWRRLVDKRAETPESISDPERKAMKTLPPLLLLEVDDQHRDPHHISSVRPLVGPSLPLLLRGGRGQHLHLRQLQADSLADHTH